jgi:succinate dehydrogenase / fumarate reductase cytochrome b subunit
MTQADRPLSPHLQIYRPQLTSVLSILHRLTGVALALGTGLLVWWLAAAAAGPDSFAIANDFLGSTFGRLLLLGWSFALFYHLCNGIRHLFWDAGLGYEITTVNRSGWLVLVASLALTVIAWLAAYAARGGS